MNETSQETKESTQDESINVFDEHDISKQLEPTQEEIEEKEQDEEFDKSDDIMDSILDEEEILSEEELNKRIDEANKQIDNNEDQEDLLSTLEKDINQQCKDQQEEEQFSNREKQDTFKERKRRYSYTPVKRPKNRVIFKCTEKQLGEGIITKILNYWRHDLEIWKICRKINPLLRRLKNDTSSKKISITALDVYAIIKIAMKKTKGKSNQIKQRQYPKNELTVLQFEKLYQVWLEGFSEETIIKRLEIGINKEGQARNLVRALNKRYKEELNENEEKELQEYNEQKERERVESLKSEAIKNDPNNNILKFGEIKELGVKKNKYFIARLDKLPLELRRAVEDSTEIKNDS